MIDNNFGSLGSSFQKSLIKILFEDSKFTTSIIDVIESRFFDGPYFKFIVENFKELYFDYGMIPTFENVKQKIIRESNNESEFNIHFDTLNSIIEHKVDNDQWIKDVSINFCKQQVLKRDMGKIQKIIEKGNFDEYQQIEKIVQDALRVGTRNENLNDVFDFEEALKENSRKTIPTGVKGLDLTLKGGLAKGELGIVIAPTGVGKTTLLTMFANSAFNSGMNVLQIFFEDNVNTILRKHYTIWTGIIPDDQYKRKEEIISSLKEIKDNTKNQLKLLKLPSDSVTISEIKSQIRKLKAEGFIPDMILVDYVDCIVPEKTNYNEEWKGEGAIMRSLETMTDEFDVSLWCATQGNRASISSEVVTTDQMGGSIKKAQIGHVVISVGKTMEQKTNKLATITILKSRVGDDGIVFSNCKFDNELLKIDTDNMNTMLGFKEEKAEQNKKHASDLYIKRQETI
jgi:replicative DNA helicase